MFDFNSFFLGMMAVSVFNLCFDAWWRWRVKRIVSKFQRECEALAPRELDPARVEALLKSLAEARAVERAASKD